MWWISNDWANLGSSNSKRRKKTSLIAGASIFGWLFAAYQPGDAPPLSSTKRSSKTGQVKKTRRIGWAIEAEEVPVSVEPFRIAARNATEAGQINNTLLEVQIEHNKTQFKNFGDRSVNSPRHLYLPLETTPKTP
jgi:hypothetical protein